ncbi:MAG: hypothetical protein AMR96_02475 [Candidatus Adiutrix intracellularis]|jgi:hypothetical protein|nr:MAG: hypothetical protein AMR96_02475 [Candidatus Adiutrix intracellularis]
MKSKLRASVEGVLFYDQSKLCNFGRLLISDFFSKRFMRSMHKMIRNLIVALRIDGRRYLAITKRRKFLISSLLFTSLRVIKVTYIHILKIICYRVLDGKWS